MQIQWNLPERPPLSSDHLTKILIFFFFLWAPLGCPSGEKQSRPMASSRKPLGERQLAIPPEIKIYTPERDARGYEWPSRFRPPWSQSPPARHSPGYIPFVLIGSSVSQIAISETSHKVVTYAWHQGWSLMGGSTVCLKSFWQGYECDKNKLTIVVLAFAKWSYFLLYFKSATYVVQTYVM